MSYAILTHGGAASPNALSTGRVVAAQAAQVILASGGDALAAALAATVVLEDDPRFNADTGSNLRLDGRLIEMDASVMTSGRALRRRGQCAAREEPRARRRQGPGDAAPLLAGDGATAFARRLGFPVFDSDDGGRAPQVRPRRGRAARARRVLRRRRAPLARHRARQRVEFSGGAVWGQGEPSGDDDESTSLGFPSIAGPPGRRPARRRPPRRRRAPGAERRVRMPEDEGCDTVGAVLRDAQGRYCATASTGRTLYMLKGRIGDSPLMGCGVYAGPRGAVAATGIGEEIVRALPGEDCLRLARGRHDGARGRGAWRRALSAGDSRRAPRHRRGRPRDCGEPRHGLRLAGRLTCGAGMATETRRRGPR